MVMGPESRENEWSCHSSFRAPTLPAGSIEGTLRPGDLLDESVCPVRARQVAMEPPAGIGSGRMPIILHEILISHNCVKVRAALKLKGLAYESVPVPSPDRSEVRRRVTIAWSTRAPSTGPSTPWSRQ